MNFRKEKMSVSPIKTNDHSIYDQNNIFAKIIRGEAAAQKIYENDHALAFYNLYPQAPVHVLIIPKGPYCNIDDFYTTATPDEILGFSQAISQVINILSLKQDGYRMITNCGSFGHQEIFHFHFHLLSGRPLGKLIS